MTIAPTPPHRGAPVRLLWGVLRDAAQAWRDDRAMRKGAALAYYTAFSLAPLLVIAINIAGIAFGRKAATGEIYGRMHAVLGSQGASVVQAMIANAARPGSGIWPTVVGVVTIMIGATSALVELKDGLDQIWKVPAAVGTVGRYFVDFMRTRLLVVGMILMLALLLLASLVMSAVLTALSRLWSEGAATTALLQGGNFAFSFVLITALLATVYKMLPSVRLAWGDVIFGAAVTALLFAAGKYFIGLYLRYSAAASMYGAAGSLLVVLMWAYYSAQILFYGAELTKIYAHRFGSRRASGNA